ncbi:hypothetical protein LINPERHAP2_LOCUS4171, partial [Linum perenne]
AVDLSTWEINNAKVFSWIIGSVEPTIALTLRTFDSVADVWVHLQKTYSEINTSRVFEVEYDLARLSLGDMDIRTFHLTIGTLWTEQDLLFSSLLTSAASSEIRQECHRRVLQFLMKFRPEYESVRSQLIQANIVHMDKVLGDLFRAETRLKTQAHIDGSHVDGGSVFAAHPGRSSSISQRTPLGYGSVYNSSSRPQFGVASSCELKCRHCGEHGHVQSTCRKRKFCNYIKKPGHIISDCCKCSFHNSNNVAASHMSFSSFNQQPSNSYTVSSTTNSSDINALVQQTIQQTLPTALNVAFATFGVTGISRPWNLDSACFNHMTGSSVHLLNYRPLHNAAVQVANGEKFNIVGIGDYKTGHLTLQNTLHVPSLVPNLVSVGQLTDNGYVVTFSSSGSVVQDRRTGRSMGVGHKVGRNFYLRSLPIHDDREVDVSSKVGVGANLGERNLSCSRKSNC